MSLEFKTLAVSVSATGVCHVELNRPKRLNAMSNEFFAELGQCFRAISRNADVRVVVLSAAGRMFTAGLDLGDVAFLMQDMEVSRKAAFVRQHVAGSHIVIKKSAYCNLHLLLFFLEAASQICKILLPPSSGVRSP